MALYHKESEKVSFLSDKWLIRSCRYKVSGTNGQTNERTNKQIDGLPYHYIPPLFRVYLNTNGHIPVWIISGILRVA